MKMPEFGRGGTASIVNAPEFGRLAVRDQALVFGWANGCPVALDLTDPQNPTPGRGPEAMLKRYGEINLWFGQIVRMAKAENPDLAKQLTTSVVRQHDEPVGLHERASVPINFYDVMAPMGTLPGYALPRLMAKQAKGNEGLVRGLNAYERAIKKAGSPITLLPLVAEDLAQTGDLDPQTILATALPTGWMCEHNARTMLQSVKGAFVEHAPTLWDLHESLDSAQRDSLKIA